MASVIIRLPDQDKRMLELLAQQHSTTVSQLVRQAVAAMINSEKTTLKPEKKTNSLVALGKLAESQAKKLDLSQMPKHLSTNFKKILYK